MLSIKNIWPFLKLVRYVIIMLANNTESNTEESCCLHAELVIQLYFNVRLIVSQKVSF